MRCGGCNATWVALDDSASMMATLTLRRWLLALAQA
jgi:hypothetical protein